MFAPTPPNLTRVPVQQEVMPLRVVATGAGGGGGVRRLSILGASAIRPIYVVHTAGPPGTSIRQVPASAVLYGSREPAALMVNHRKTLNIPGNAGSIKSQP